ncbi:flavin-dependent oxidoreductase [Oceanobacillus senegalensis]|uniref:flavin-dependent oxidoreductase n=1 Tax=Oceanobacillus senegalensis TaxID=1936063 RepID=UPI000A30F60C|nr:flavin-dependent oxidoreductase [Oceanobacillus senegalensis]
MVEKRKAMIAGGGIGGLTAALKLHEAGVSVQVFESVREIKALGVGINVQPHAIKILSELGLADELKQIGVETADLSYYNKFGKLIWQEPRGMNAGYRYPQYSIHRGELQMLLLNAVKERLGEDSIKTGHQLISFQRHSDIVEAHFEDKKTGEKLGSYTADMLIAADGIHSTIRKFYYPNEGEPIFSNRILWRGITEGEPFLTGKSMVMAGHQNQKFVAYPISPQAEKTGHSVINWIAELWVDGDAPSKADWNKKIDKSKFAPDFASWDFGWLNVPQLIDEAEAVFEFPMVDRDPLPQWTFGRVTLLGDAAHPMYPIGSNGASQAIIDAEELGLAVQKEASLDAALQAYESARLTPTANIVKSNRKNGPDSVMQIVEERAPNGFNALHDVISQQELEDIANQYKKITGFDRAR